LKNFFKNIKKNSYKLLKFINNIIDNKYFRPLSISVILIFFIFKAYQYISFYFHNKQYNISYKNFDKSIKISLTDSALKIDFEDEQVIQHLVKNGDTLLKILADFGAEEQEVFSIISALKKIKPSLNLNLGDKINITYKALVADTKNTDKISNNSKITILNLTIPSSLDEKIVISRKSDDSYDAREIEVKLLKYNSKYFGTIKNGLFVDGVESGISPNSMMNMINLYGYDVDFQRDIHSGDKFEMLVESYYDENGKKVRDGNVLFSSLTLQNRSIEIYMHKIDGRIEYFDAKGNSIKKSLLRTPINGARISSGFGMRRHPILGYSKMHKGVDFSASSGTPILAAGNGVIIYMAVKGGYGNYVQIRHNNDYATAYGHASRFNRKFRVGSKVKQGDVVAYVGSTGRSTGPHLHFELLYRGTQVNPAKVKATSGIKLVGKELVRFESSKNEIDKYRKNTPNLLKKSSQL
jgi:murein DD-endopeptidase MepM/ murein hydrolase activator NlpD